MKNALAKGYKAPSFSDVLIGTCETRILTNRDVMGFRDSGRFTELSDGSAISIDISDSMIDEYDALVTSKENYKLYLARSFNPFKMDYQAVALDDGKYIIRRENCGWSSIFHQIMTILMLMIVATMFNFGLAGLTMPALSETNAIGLFFTLEALMLSRLVLRMIAINRAANLE